MNDWEAYKHLLKMNLTNQQLFLLNQFKKTRICKGRKTKTMNISQSNRLEIKTQILNRNI